MTVNTYAISIEFIGTRYRGWQRQQEVDSIQQHVEAALSKIANEPIEVIAAGRTDAGVHASNMIAHFQTSATRQPYNWLRAANSLLPDDIAVRWIQVMPAEFHARLRSGGGGDQVRRQNPARGENAKPESGTSGHHGIHRL